MDMPPKSGVRGTTPAPDGDLASELPTSEGPSIHARRVIANRYEILFRLGKGGMGEVWHAYDLKLRVDVALKSLRPDQRRGQDLVEALRREVRTAREVISPNVCRIFDLVVERDQELISMEYIDGTTLLAKLVQKGALELSEARDIAAQFLAGLEAIHQAGLVHRDLKPENIMITRAGRVVVMDFGIAKQVTQLSGTVSGTPPYMSPEQLSGEKVDARSDVFSAGVVLAEMIHPEGILSHKTREDIWNAVRQDPMRLADGPWKAVIARAVAFDPGDRFSSAGALSRALEEATQRVETIEERRPYPGLASFTVADAEYFFGRELEVETVIKKIQQLHLMALVGASGAGKTSFLRAGFIHALQQGWSHVFCVPGDSPLLNLGQALVPELSGDTEAMQKMLRWDDPSVALWLLNHWRKKHTEAVLIIDRFEELFTLNGPEVQSRFAELIAGAALESDVRVLLSMRDDFLLRCHDYPSLAPIFSELTPLGALTGPALRRALVQPALMCGYRYEDETLIDEILSDVEKERGALPLMAFAAARLWEKRDRASGKLTREAYRQVGGVAGALAQHAESTMDRIGSERQPIVREIFRNLITAENTRAARDTEELLSVFQKDPGGRASLPAVEEVLRALIDARLLTSFEAPSAEGEKPRRRVEIIHESLLSEWPRLVRWQTQDVDSAQLRDQLRQASQLWEQRSRSEDLLWTGAAFLEFQAWRQRYPGGLTTTEEAFAHAMTQRANKRRRQRRIAVAAIFVILLSILAVIGNFWQKATVARDEAVSETRRAEAGKVLAIGRAIPEADPGTKLAYALASLEFADTPQGRRFALQALSEGPPAQVIEVPAHISIELSPDENWIAAGVLDGAVQLLSSNGSLPQTVSEPFKANYYIPWNSQFSPDGQFLMYTWREDPGIVKVWSLSQKKVIRTFDMGGLTICLVRAGKAFLITDTQRRLETPFQWNQVVVRVWTFDRNEPEIVGRFNMEKNGWRSLDIDSKGRSIAYKKGHDICIRSLNESDAGAEKLVGSQLTDVDFIRFHPSGAEIASSDSTGEIRLWSLIPGTKNPVRVIAGKGGQIRLWFAPKGRFLYASSLGLLSRWDLSGPDDADAFVFRSVGEEITSVMFDKEDRWLAVGGRSTIGFYRLADSYPYIFHGKGSSSNIRFTPDGKSFMNGFSEDGIRVWNMPGNKESATRTLWHSAQTSAESIDIDPRGKYVLAATPGSGVHLISISDGKDLFLQGLLPAGVYSWVAFSPDGKSAAALGVDGIEIWNLQSGKSRVLDRSKGIGFYSLKYSADGSLFSGDARGKLYHWDLNNASAKVLGKGKAWVSGIAISNDARYVAASTWSAKNMSEMPNATSELVLYDLKERKSIPISSHGNRVFCVAFDPRGTRLVTGDFDGIIRVGPMNGETPHLLLGHESAVKDIVVHPGGHWIASTDFRSVVRLWAMPQGKPLEALSYNEFLDWLSELTNLRAVQDASSPTGYRIRYVHFAGSVLPTD
jgi:WD40 repeat protein/predicted Ser/Thr protein kinase